METTRDKSEGDDVLSENENKDADHISRLCDAVIHHILSFLPATEAARTSILSKRWRNLWASIPNLDFDQRFFIDTIGGDLRSHPARALADFMSGALMSRERAPIHLLRMSLDYNPSFYYLIRQWIQLSMKFNIQEIHLNLYGGDFFRKNHSLYSVDSFQAYHCYDDKGSRRSWDYDSGSDSTNDAADDGASESASESDTSDESDSDSDEKESASSDNESGNPRFAMISSLFTYTSIRVLQLARCKIKHEGDIGFKHLTSLVLRDVDISEQLLHEMLSKCSLLEKLELRKMVKLKHLDFSAPKLYSMKLECCHSLKKVLIDAQELRHFKFGVSSTLKEVSLHFPALVKAEIGLCHNINCNKKKRASRLVKLLQNFFHHVKDLTLYSKYFKDIIVPKVQMENLTMSNTGRVEIIGEMGKGAISAIFGLLKAFDSLESLCLTCVHPKRQQNKVKALYEAMQLRKVDIASLSCLQFHLKDLKINGFEGSDIQLKLLELIQENAKALKNVEISTHTPSFLTHKEIKARLSSFCCSQEVEMKYE